MPSVGSFKAEALPKNYVGLSAAGRIFSVADIAAWVAANPTVTSVGSQYYLNGTMTASVGPTAALSSTTATAIGVSYRNLGKTIRIGTSGQPDALVLQLVQPAGTSADNGQPSTTAGRGYVIVANNTSTVTVASSIYGVTVARA